MNVVKNMNFWTRLSLLVVAIIVGCFPNICFGQTSDRRIYRNIATTEDAVWMTTSDGFEKFDKVNGTYDSYYWGNGNDFYAVAASSDGSVFVSEKTKGLARFENNMFNPVIIDGYNLNGTRSLNCTDGLWIGSGWSLIYDNGHSINEWPCPKDNEYDAVYYFSNLRYDPNSDRMWFGVVSTGLSNKFGYVDGNGTMKFVNTGFYSHLPESPAHESPSVNELYVSGDGMVYIASDCGMYVLSGSRVKKMDCPVIDTYESCNSITGDVNTIWFAAGDSIIGFDGQDYTEYTFTLSETPDDFIMKLLKDGEKIWVLMKYSGLYEFKDNEFSLPTFGVNSREETQIEIFRSEDNTIYDLGGRKISKSESKQLYIVNGRVTTVRH